jgi:hypothetical protein
VVRFQNRNPVWRWLTKEGQRCAVLWILTGVAMVTYQPINQLQFVMRSMLALRYVPLSIIISKCYYLPSGYETSLKNTAG